MIVGPPSEHEVEQLAALTRARRRATGLLAVVAVGFAASLALPDGTAVGYLRAALEAGLVGGLADWFAVVALFRHPLGIPIPHTAVIPRSKDGLGANLAGFVRDNFLSGEQVTERLADPAHMDRLGQWLADPGNADRVAARAAGLAVAALDGVDEDALVERVVAGVRRRLDRVPVSELAGEALAEAIREQRHVELVDRTIEALRTAVIRNRGPLREQLGHQSPAWVPEFVDDLVFDRAEEVARRFLADLADHPEHRLRGVIDQQLLDITDRMQDDPGVQDRIQRAAHEVLDDEQLRRWVRAWWKEVRQRVEEAGDPDAHGGTLRSVAGEAIVDLGGRLQDDEQLRGRLLTSLESVAPRLAATGQQEVGGIIGATIDRWDAQETSRRLETWMGPDLQFVRINGTVVGALVGVVLHTVAALVA